MIPCQGHDFKIWKIFVYFLYTTFSFQASFPLLAYFFWLFAYFFCLFPLSACCLLCSNLSTFLYFLLIFPLPCPGAVWQWLGTMDYSSGSQIFRTTEFLECYFSRVVQILNSKVISIGCISVPFSLCSPSHRNYKVCSQSLCFETMVKGT